MYEESPPHTFGTHYGLDPRLATLYAALLVRSGRFTAARPGLVGTGEVIDARRPDGTVTRFLTEAQIVAALFD